ncbi:uridine kinase [Henriciella algicola]|jgi:uridine kinase|uniref:uridine/cytidine kinase n=1 Tax=Henriciella algicola TaxID=1608422 RepID=A0A399RK69_9PROT|nr:uridine kinase [Henriciella algicola]RIJ32066.1 uridine kinase [Henriciella algicola]
MTTSPFLIAMSGGSGSGKSTLADALIERLGPDRAVIFHEDGYYWPMRHYGPCETPEQRAAIIEQANYDDPASKDTAHLVNDIRALKRGQVIEQPVYDFDRHDRDDSRTLRIAPAPVIILEGIHALSVKALRPLIDLSIYVDTPDDLRLARRIRRDVVERERTVQNVLEHYLKTVRAAHYKFTHPSKFEAELVIADEGLPAYGKVCPGEDAIDRMLAPVVSRLQLMGVL